MSIVNKKNHNNKKRVSGGQGKEAIKETDFDKLKRLMQLAVIGEERYYPEGVCIEKDIIELTKKAINKNPKKLITLINYVRLEIGLRHSPLLSLLGVLKKDPKMLKSLDDKFFLRPTDLTDMVSLYFKLNEESKTLPRQLKKAMEKALNCYDLYQFAKYGRHKKNLNVNLVDVFNLVHPKPKSEEQNKLFRKVIEQDLPMPETWEYLLSNSSLPRKEAWELLIKNKKLPALATIRNIRNMLKDEVNKELLLNYIKILKLNRIFPAQILSAIVNIDDPDIRNILFEKLKEKNGTLKGKTLIVLDISGSMGRFDLTKNFLRSYAFRAISVLLSIILNSEEYELVLTAGDDYERKHKSAFIDEEDKSFLKNGQIEEFLIKIEDFYKDKELGWGGIFTKQCLKWVKKQNKGYFDRVIVISDSQDMDYSKTNKSKLPNIAKYQYINNIAAYKYVGYAEHLDKKGNPWKEITTYSSKIVDFILLNEKEF